MKQAFGLIELLFWGAVAFLIASHANDIVVWGLTALYSDPSKAPAVVLSNLAYISPVFPLALGLIAIARIKLDGARVNDIVGFSAQRLPGDILLGAAAGAVSLFVSIASMRIASQYLPMPPFHLMPPSLHVYFVTIGAIIPGFCEELYFRGLMFRSGRALPKALVLVLTAAAFSLWHIGSPAYLPHTFMLGLIFGAIVWRVDRIMPAIIAHCCANAGVGILLLNGFVIAPAV